MLDEMNSIKFIESLVSYLSSMAREVIAGAQFSHIVP